MKERIAFNSEERTKQFANIQDEIALLLDSDSEKSSSENSQEEETKAEEIVRITRESKEEEIAEESETTSLRPRSR